MWVFIHDTIHLSYAAIDENDKVCYYVTMQPIKIYRDGHYSLKDNLKNRVKMQLPVIESRVDNFFTKIYSL